MAQNIRNSSELTVPCYSTICAQYLTEPPQPHGPEAVENGNVHTLSFVGLISRLQPGALIGMDTCPERDYHTDFCILLKDVDCAHLDALSLV